MVKLGPIREEALSVLRLAAIACEDEREHHAWSLVMRTIGDMRRLDVDLLNAADELKLWTEADFANDWTRNVSRFCADVLRWAHEEERKREIHAMQGFWTMFDADPQTRAPTMRGWLAIAQEIEKWLCYDVKADNGIQLRHGRLSFDSERKVSVFTWTERKKLLNSEICGKTSRSKIDTTSKKRC